MLARAHWAASAFASYDLPAVLRIAEAVATAAHAESRRFAEWAVKETGFGVAEHKVIKNEACSLGLFERYAGEDLVSPRIDPDAKIVALPRPAGVVLALIPSTNPVASVFFKVILSMLTRNAVVVSPHPMAKGCCVEAADLLAEAAIAAGAPDGVIQVVREPTVRLVETLMSDPVTDVIVATGGTAMVRAAYRSGNPALGVGPGNVPVLVDATADIAAAARRIADSKAFDNSVLCTNESVLIVQDSVRDALLTQLQRQRAVLLDETGRDKLRAYLFPDGLLNGDAIGKDASWIASQAGIRVPPRTRLLLAPVDLVVPEEPFCREKLCPVLGVATVPTAAAGIEAARAVVRIGGAGHSAAIHSEDPATIMNYGARVPVLRVAVNVGNSTGSSGLETSLALVDDAGHRLRRPQLDRGEPGTPAPGELDPDRVQRRSRRGVRRLRRDQSLARARRPGAGLPDRLQPAGRRGSTAGAARRGRTVVRRPRRRAQGRHCRTRSGTRCAR